MNVYTDNNEANEQNHEKHFNSILEGKVREYLREWVKDQNWEDAIDFEDQALKSLVNKFFDLNNKTEDIDNLTKLLRNGQGNQVIPALGIIMSYFIIEDVRLMGDVSRQAERKIIRRMQGEEEIEGAKYVKPLAKLLGISEPEALRIMQIERGKITHEIMDLNINASPEIMASAMSLIAEYKQKSR